MAENYITDRIDLFGLMPDAFTENAYDAASVKAVERVLNELLFDVGLYTDFWGRLIELPEWFLDSLAQKVVRVPYYNLGWDKPRKVAAIESSGEDNKRCATVEFLREFIKDIFGNEADISEYFEANIDRGLMLAVSPNGWTQTQLNMFYNSIEQVKRVSQHLFLVERPEGITDCSATIYEATALVIHDIYWDKG